MMDDVNKTELVVAGIIGVVALTAGRAIFSNINQAPRSIQEQRASQQSGETSSQKSTKSNNG